MCTLCVRKVRGVNDIAADVNKGRQQQLQTPHANLCVLVQHDHIVGKAVGRARADDDLDAVVRRGSHAPRYVCGSKKSEMEMVAKEVHFSRPRSFQTTVCMAMAKVCGHGLMAVLGVLLSLALIETMVSGMLKL